MIKESVVSARLVLLVVRSRRPVLTSRPGTALLVGVIAVIAAAVVLPTTPAGRLLGLCPVPAAQTLAMGEVAVVHVAAAGASKRFFYR